VELKGRRSGPFFSHGLYELVLIWWVVFLTTDYTDFADFNLAVFLCRYAAMPLMPLLALMPRISTNVANWY
jgi:hypothetical protein